MKSMKNVSHIVSYMNNRAVALAKTNRYEDAVELYHSTINALSEDKKEISHRISYNLAMCYARGKNYEDCLHVLKDVIKGADGISKKAKSLHAKVEVALKKGTVLHFPEDKPKSDKVTHDVAQLLDAHSSKEVARQPGFNTVTWRSFISWNICVPIQAGFICSNNARVKYQKIRKYIRGELILNCT